MPVEHQRTLHDRRSTSRTHVAVVERLESRRLLSGVVFPADSNVVDVTAARWGAVPNDGIDDTAAIQAALSTYPSGNRIIYLPDGVYDVSSQLRWPAGTAIGNYAKRTILQGQSRDGTVLRLTDGATGFQDAAAPQVVVWTGDGPADRFRNSVRDLTISTGRNNPGAAAITFNASNQGIFENVLLLDEDNRAKFGMVWTNIGDSVGPMLVRDVEIRGFDIGIRPRQQVASIVFEDLTLVGQRTYGIQNQNQNLFIRNLTSRNSVTVIYNEKDSNAYVTLLGATLTGLTGAATRPAIYNEKAMYVRDLQTTGYQVAIKHFDKGRGNEPGVYGPNVHEWAGSGSVRSLFPTPEQPLNLPIKERPQLPWDDLGQWVSPKSFGGIAGDGIDDTVAIQRAIDSGKSTVYLPNGRWTVNGTVNVRGNVRRIIGTEANVDGSGTFIFQDGAAPVVLFERIDMNYANIKVTHNTTRTVVVANVSGGTYRNTPRGTGDLFIDDWVAAPFVFAHGQHVWARQIDQETDTQATADPTDAKIINDGAVVWILGLKTEQAGTAVRTQNGGTTEIIGGWSQGNGQAKVDPLFVNDNSNVSIAGVHTLTFNNTPWTTFMQETRGTETRTLASFPMSYVGYTPAAAPSVPAEVVMDTEDATGVTVVGAWTASVNSTNAWHGTGYLHDGNIAKGSKSITFTPTLPSAGEWEVYLKWPGGTGRATNVPVDIVGAGGTTTVLVNQVQSGSWGVSLGTHRLRADGTAQVRIRTTGTNGNVIADAVQFVQRSTVIVPATPAPVDAVLTASDAARFSWTAVAGAEGYYVERATGDAGFVRVADVPVTVAAYDDAALTEGVTYRYRVTAYNWLGTSAASAVASVTPRAVYDVTQQAEAGTIGGGAVRNASHGGYYGTGFVDFNRTGGFVDWTFRPTHSGTYTLSFRYALGAAAPRTGALSVNGTTVTGGVTFASTGTWTGWSILTITLDLTAGDNVIRLSSIGQDLANVDAVTLRSA